MIFVAQRVFLVKTFFDEALLALASLTVLRVSERAGLALIWVFNFWGLADLLNAVGRGLLFTPDGALGAAFWIPLVIVPLLVVSHVYIFNRLWAETHGRCITMATQHVAK